MPATQMAGNSFFLSTKPVLSQKRNEKMKKYSILLIIIVSLSGCKKASNAASITGEIKGLGNDTIYLYGTDGLYDRIDTIYVEGGKFSHTANVDTITPVTLLFKDQTEYPVFLDKGNKIKIEGSADNLEYLTINGNTANEEFTAFQQALKGLGKPSQKVLEEKAEAFIRQHHSSFVSIYLLDKYFVQKEAPDFVKIKQLIDVMTGILQDKPYIEDLESYIGELDKANVGKYAPYFNLPNAKGEKLSRSSDIFKEKYLLLNFWASWCDSCSTSNAELRDINRIYKKNKKFSILGISMDIDKKSWKEAIKKDTLSWEQVCNFTGMNSETMTQFAVLELPTNILLSPEGKILARDLKGDSLKKKLKEVLAEEKDKKEKKK